MRLRRALGSRWFKLLLSAALLALLLYETNLPEIGAALSQAHVGWLLLALAGVIASQALSAYRWALLAQAVGFTDPFVRVCTYYFSGMYLNLFGPGTVAGDVGRSFFLAAGRRRALALTTVVAHRAIGFVALAWLCATAVVFLPDQPLPGLFRWLAALAVPVTIAAWLWGPRLAVRLLPRANRWRVLIEDSLAPYWNDRLLLGISLALGVVVQLLQFGAQMLVAHAIGLRLPAAFFFVVVPVIGALGALPFSLQGIGVREAGYSYYLSQIGVPRESALALGLLSSAVVLASGLSGLPAFLFMRRQEAPADEENQRKEEGERRKEEGGK
jgi:glycosyltransferase 2 family protein